MTDEEYVIVLKNCAFMLADGIKYMKEEQKKEFKKAYERAIEKLSVEPQEWISVKEHGKPKKSGKYWVTIQSTTSDVKWVRADEYHAERDFFDTELEWSNSGIKITAWQPITEPSPYKGE